MRRPPTRRAIHLLYMATIAEFLLSSPHGTWGRRPVHSSRAPIPPPLRPPGGRRRSLSALSLCLLA
eukprot:scaffold228098_cov36-Tisochrysis_lutea.AAC.1